MFPDMHIYAIMRERLLWIKYDLTWNNVCASGKKQKTKQTKFLDQKSNWRLFQLAHPVAFTHTSQAKVSIELDTKHWNDHWMVENKVQSYLEIQTSKFLYFLFVKLASYKQACWVQMTIG